MQVHAKQAGDLFARLISPGQEMKANGHVQIQGKGSFPTLSPPVTRQILILKTRSLKIF